MKKILLTATIAFAAFGTFAQGYVNFANDSTATISNILTGARAVTGPTFLAQLYNGPAGATEGALVAVTNAPISFGLPGRVTGGGRFLDAAVVPIGAIGTFQIRAWEAALGGDYETAYVNWLSGSGAFAGKVLGRSNLVQAKPADGTAQPLPLATPLTGLQSFYLVPVPEPSVIALGALGLAALLYRRRK